LLRSCEKKGAEDTPDPDRDCALHLLVSPHSSAFWHSLALSNRINVYLRVQRGLAPLAGVWG